MNGKLYKNKSDKIYVNKSLSNENSITLHFKDNSDVVNPTIYISRSINIENYNYILVNGNIDRYYYIDSFEVSQQYYILHCHVDVLMTYKTAILNEECVIAKNEKVYNLFLDDDRMKLYNKSRILTRPFTTDGEAGSDPKGFLVDGQKTWTMVLTLNGSGSTSSSGGGSNNGGGDDNGGGSSNDNGGGDGNDNGGGGDDNGGGGENPVNPIL